ncbi:hypothetical protein ACFY1L_10785 [Streptomyces sp. NPDC001663]|uniref:hypothetical protein n=1 Tax=Streptomyces sp. NPDC001663 TaxID=3364597 RepID=UPI0036B165AF
MSEVVAIMNSDPFCREVNIVGDGAWAVYNTPSVRDINDVFRTAYTINSMIQVLNYELRRRRIDAISVGLGMSYGRALMIKAGYSGSGLHDVVYMGDVVNQSAKLAAHGNKSDGDEPLMVSDLFYQNLTDKNKGLLRWNHQRKCWNGNVVDSEMEAWFKENCK